jgi:hypothetical protein
VRVLALLLLTAALLFSASFKLYLKDGTYQVVREYKVEGDRIRYYSSERSQWEEIPVALCDLKKTEATRKQAQEELQNETKLADEEEAIERAQRKEIERIPMNPGAYFVQDGQVKNLEYADTNFVKSKKRSILQKITPIPVVSGKERVELNGEHAAFIVHQDLPEFYLRLEQEDRFGILQLTSKDGKRIVEHIDIAPITNENFENAKKVPVFQRELASGLYKVWPEKPLAPGEYALVEYVGTDSDLRIWDFAYQPQGK